ncbi:MAG: hypothetical protein HKP25_11175 [Marinicaulis sp.]|nr:hypothetical protein [Marinicaulis sp.]
MFRKILFAGAAAVLLHSCATAPSSAPLTAQDLLSGDYAVSTATPFDVDAFLGAFPDWMTSSYANASFDAGAGAMVIDGLKIGLSAMPGMTLDIVEVRIWSPDIAAMEAVYAGTADYVEMSKLVDRVALYGIQPSGLQRASGSQSGAMTIDQLVFDGVSARSFAIPENPNAPADIRPLRWLAAVNNSYAFDGVAYSGLSFQMNDNQGNEVSISVNEGFARGYDRGYTAYQSARNIRYETSTIGAPPVHGPKEVAFKKEGNPKDQKRFAKILQPEFGRALEDAFSNPVAILAQAYGGTSSAQSIEFVEWSDYDLSKILPYLVRWQMPPTSERNILSLGRGATVNASQSLNGRMIYSAARSEFDLSNFAWLIPTRLGMAETGSMFDAGAMMDIANAQGVNTPEFNQARQMLADIGLEQIRFDSSFDWLWNPDTGAASLGQTAAIQGFADIGFGVDAGGPSFDGWLALSDGTLDAEPEDLISLANAHFAVRDSGALDKLFALAAAQSGAGTGEDLRAAAPAMLRMSGAQAAEINPRIAGYIEGVATFIEAGGEIEVTIAPATPVKLNALNNVGPDTLPDLLNLNIIHRP